MGGKINPRLSVDISLMMVRRLLKSSVSFAAADTSLALVNQVIPPYRSL